MESSVVWLSYDLGATGDYEGMYAWLDNLGAKECGSSVAYIKRYEHDGDLIDALREGIAEHVQLGKRARVYAIARRNDGRTVGKYVIGRRKASPWEGFGDADETQEDFAGLCARCQVELLC